MKNEDWTTRYVCCEQANGNRVWRWADGILPLRGGARWKHGHDAHEHVPGEVLIVRVVTHTRILRGRS